MIVMIIMVMSMIMMMIIMILTKIIIIVGSCKGLESVRLDTPGAPQSLPQF